MASAPVAFNELSEQLLIGRALEHASSPVAMLDRGARVVWSNKAYLHSVEQWRPAVARGPQVSANIAKVCQQLQTSLGAEYRELWRLVHEGNSWSGTVTLPSAIPGIEGETIFDCILSPLPDAQGRAAYFLLLLHDVTTHHKEKLRATHTAQHDQLTGLGNRLRLREVAEGLLARNQAFALFYMDLDGFKGVNDRFGHATGDEVLQAFAQHLRSAARETDLPIRLGGDEFVLVLPSVGPDYDLKPIADRIITTAQDAFGAVNPLLVGKVGVSIGGARYPSEGRALDELLAKADTALYAAKHAGKGCFRLGGPDAPA